MPGLSISSKTGVIVSLTITAVFLACVALLSGQAVPSEAEVFQKDIQPFLVNNCAACHNAKLLTGGVNLQSFADLAAAKKQPEVWAKVLNMVSSGQMPPAGMPVPPKDQVNVVTKWISSTFGFSATAPPTAVAAPSGDAGRVTLRRLNRVEYDNTIHDLLGLNVKVADEFPLDASGYGFDNNGDVLTLSPLLMEKYIAVAARLSKLAVFGPDLPKEPGLLGRLRPATVPSTGTRSSSLTFTVLPYSMRGVLQGTFDFPKDGEYEFQFRPGDARGLDKPYLPPAPAGGATTAQAAAAPSGASGAKRPARRVLTPEEIKERDAHLVQEYPPANWVFELDGKAVAEGSHAGGYNIDQGARPTSTYRQKLSAGVHSFRISYPALANIASPLDNIIASRKTKALQIGQLDILGPYQPDPAPPLSYRKLFICGERTPACAQRIIESFATRAYRRPATSQEVSELMGMVRLTERQGKPFEEGIRLAVQTALLSPDFLFRVERDRAGKGAAAAYPLNDYELASRLSYFLWSSMPDEGLMQKAKAGTLRQPTVLESEVKRMLADPKAGALAENFGGQWLGLRELGQRRPDPEKFPGIDDDMLLFMRQETNLFFTAITKEDRSILDFIDAPFTYVNGPLARHYGIAGVDGFDFQRVELKTGQRSGILTQGSVLTVSSFPTRTSVVTRGKWVLENLLGTPPPPPPPDVPALKDGDIGTAVTLRERMQQHRADPACASCHSRMDPIGFSLENYDAAGAWRANDGSFPIDATGVLPDGKSFNGAKGLKQILRSQSDLFTRNFTEKLLTYALGRGVEAYDKPVVDGILQHSKASDYRFSTLILEVVKSKPFEMRDGEIQ